MRCPLLFIGAVVSADNACPSEDVLASPGVALLQKPGVTADLQHVDLGFVPNSTAAESQQIPLISGEVTEPGLLELEKELDRAANQVILNGLWSRWTPGHHHHHKTHGVHEFLSSVVIFDWSLFASAIMAFIILHMTVLGRLSDKGYHLTVLMVWLTLGGIYNAIIWARFGRYHGVSWFAGYLLEYIFLIENIFIFHIVIQAFKTPLRLTPKILHIVVWGQIMFEMVFFMGLASWLRSFKVLPYLLGVWLIICGILSTRGDHSMEIDIMETRACQAFTSCLGDRLSPEYEKDGGCLMRDSTGRIRISLLGLTACVLLLADFMLEIDVVLTKIEELPNPYIAFTSSAVAAFSIPELFFVSKTLLQQFVMLKYGIGFVLVLFGIQMLLSSVYVLRPIVACGIIVGVLIACVVISALSNCHRGCNAQESLMSSNDGGISGPATAEEKCSVEDDHAGNDEKHVIQDEGNMIGIAANKESSEESVRKCHEEDEEDHLATAARMQEIKANHDSSEGSEDSTRSEDTNPSSLTRESVICA